jgi:paraquat-inducible protein A
MTNRTRAAIAALLILAATACLALGLTMPIIRLNYLYFWTDTYSLVGVIHQLYAAGELFLAAVIALFSVALPALKLATLLLATIPGHQSRAVRRRLDWLGKWSMLDVLVMALVVFYAKTTYLSDATALSGVYLFAASVLLTMTAYALVTGDDAAQS